MSRSIQQLFEETLALPAGERETLADLIYESLDEDPAISESWINEAKRRSAEINSGVAQTAPWAGAVQRLKQKYSMR